MLELLQKLRKNKKYTALYKRFSTILIFTFLSLNLCGACSDRIEQGKDKTPVTYYLDSNNGNDESDGLSEDNAWKSLDRVMKTELNPGDEIQIKRGSEFSDVLVINNSGTAENPILLTSYGNKNLPSPAFTNPVFKPQSNQYGNCIRLKGSFIIVENMYFHHTVANLPQNAGSFLTMWELGAIYIDKNAQNCIVRNNELYDCGVGIKSYGPYAKIENNYIHDCNRVLKKWGWGPIAIWLGGDNQEVSYNRIINYSAVNPNINWGPDGYGEGADGGAIEIDDARYAKSNISIHHNYSRDCQGFIEVTWADIDQNPLYLDFSIHHNVSDDYQQFIALWQGANFSIENNTIIRRKVNENEWGVFNITQTNSRNRVRNNIIITENNVVVFNVGRQKSATPNTIIENNLYWSYAEELDIGFEGPGDSPLFSDPMFLNYDNATSRKDFLLKINSPAIGLGAL
ncbi:hypothetical protein [Flavivirga spongiicola]|uniref:Right handed beta helix domain-containing protein n=1 Tax=Flavivirga spongiicola TaxID=421621 RepID=A0ABU7XPS5_9FLAO|nr:hypothetical protein [Flavivirga sp. MEBiC05379]MDO5977521.1 hypothetical protein [Flavivirga sp. MEBiC05379]